MHTHTHTHTRTQNLQPATQEGQPLTHAEVQQSPVSVIGRKAHVLVYMHGFNISMQCGDTGIFY